MPNLPQQLINDKAYDHSSIEAFVDNVPYGGFKSIDWDHGLEPGEGRGNRAQVTLRSRGKYSANASMEMFYAQYEAMIASLGANGTRGYMEYPFDVVLHYAEQGLPLSSVIVKSARIKKEASNASEDGAIITVKADLHVMRIIRCVPGTTIPLFAVEPTKFIR